MNAPKKSRRSFIKSAGAISAGFLTMRNAVHAVETEGQVLPLEPAYGPLVKDRANVLDLPKAFEYQVLSRVGRPMSDGLLTPGAHDGMAAFPASRGRIILICNHETNPDQGISSPFGIQNQLLGKIPKSKLYDYGFGKNPGLGGTTTLVYNPKTKKVEREYMSLAGTHRNCAGGATPWNSWVSCEETVRLAGEELEKDHGYNFEVPASTRIKLADPTPLKDMGRFNHEAIAVDPASGVVYETEDRGDGLIYRFLPNVPGKLQKSGKLQALAIKAWASCDTRNWKDLSAQTFELGKSYDVEWIDLEDVEAPLDDLRYRGFEAGAARFARGEGMFYSHERVFWTCTNGGTILKGQVFAYKPSPYEGAERESEAPGKVELYLEPNNTELVEMCDNLDVSPDGGLLLCEDGKENQFLVGVTPAGKYFKLARNATGPTEFAGVCHSADGKVVFVNLQKPGLTLAITGPFQWLES
jgi:secreted PhoX family phosphatase